MQKAYHQLRRLGRTTDLSRAYAQRLRGVVTSTLYEKLLDCADVTLALAERRSGVGVHLV